MGAIYYKPNFETSPDQYHHWQLTLTFDGPVATLAMNVQEDEGLGDYTLKLNSYDIGRARVLAIIKDGPTAAKILEHLGLDSSVPECAPATGPPQLDLPLAA